VRKKYLKDVVGVLNLPLMDGEALLIQRRKNNDGKNK
jgi:hypothetical protein